MYPIPNGMMRMAQLFGNSLLQPEQSQGPYVQASNEDPIDRLRQIFEQYKPETQASQAFQQHLGTMPQRQDYPPSRLRQIGSVIAGLGAGVSPLGIVGGSPIGFRGNPEAAMETSEKYRNIPFGRATGDWERQNKPLMEAANIEKNYNLGQRQLLGTETNRMIQQQRADTYQDRVDALERAADERNRIANKRADTAEKAAETSAKRAETYDWISRHGPFTTKVDEAGNTKLIFKDGTTKDVSVDTFSPKELEELRERNREKFEGIREPNREKLKKTPSGGVSKVAKPATPAEIALRANTYKNLNPGSAKWITVDGNKVKITAPSTPSKIWGQTSGPSQEEWNAINAAVYGSQQGDIELKKEVPEDESNTDTQIDKSIFQAQQSTRPQGAGTKPQNNAMSAQIGKFFPQGVPKGRTVITDMNGKIKGTIPTEQIPDLDKSKYRVWVQ